MLKWSRRTAFAVASGFVTAVAIAGPAAAVSTNITAIVNTTGGDDTFTIEFTPGPTRTVTTVGGTGRSKTYNPSAGSSTATTGNPPAVPAPHAGTMDIILPAEWRVTGITCDIPVAPDFETPPIIDVGAGRVTFSSPDYSISLPAEVAPRRRQCTFEVAKGAPETQTGDVAEPETLLAATATQILSAGPRVSYLRSRLSGAARSTADVSASRNAARLSTSAVSEDNAMSAWFDLSASQLELGDVDARSYVAAAGVDVQLRPDFLIGLMVLADDYDADSDRSGYEAEANGAMIGPYFAKAFGRALVLDGRVLYGKGDYTLSPDGGAEGDFDASRVLAQLRLSGSVTRGSWDLHPSADLLYFRTESDAYTDSAATRIAAATHETGRVSLGVTGYYSGFAEGGLQLTPYVGLALDHYVATGDVASYEGNSGRLTLGADWQLGARSYLNAEISASGLGQDDFSATSAALAYELRF